MSEKKSFMQSVKDIAKADKQTIVLPESYDERTLKAAEQILKEGFANIILVGDEKDIKSKYKNIDLAKAVFMDNKTSELLGEFTELFVKLRGDKGMTASTARELLASNPLYFGVALVKSNRANGMVAGAENSTADVLRAALQIVGKSKDADIVSTFFVMIVPNCEYGENGTFVFADCGLMQNPNPNELANIAISSAKSFKSLIGAEPKVALLSHSTKGSSKHDDVNKVTQALQIAKSKAPNLAIDGEFQLDAAIVSSVGQKKAPDSQIAGKANVLVFPDLDAGNIGYKLVQRLAKAEAYGPITQGIAAPVNDLSRGCSSEDIVGVVAISALQAISNQK